MSFDGTKGSSVRRSLHRSLREGHLPHGHSPSIHRHKRGRESGSSVTATDDGGKSLNNEAEELKRGTGSFILHGKKASVITMAPDWQSMSNEERIKLRQSLQANAVKEASDVVDREEDAVETASNVTRPTEEDYTSLRSSRKHSFATTSGEHFVDAETGDDATPTIERNER
jgi:hypothetical protein